MVNKLVNYLINKIQAFNRDKRWVDLKAESNLYFSLFASALDTDPLSSKNKHAAPLINVVILVGPLDIEHCRWTIEGAVTSSLNPIKKIKLITPKSHVNLLREAIKDLDFMKKVVSKDIEIVTDENLLSLYPSLLAFIKRIDFKRQNW